MCLIWGANNILPFSILYLPDYKEEGTCGTDFQCDSGWCIDEDLVCDNIDNCGDYSDEQALGRSKCKEGGNLVL